MAPGRPHGVRARPGHVGPPRTAPCRPGGPRRGRPLSGLALAGHRVIRLDSRFVADFRRKTGDHFCEICLRSVSIRRGRRSRRPAALSRLSPVASRRADQKLSATLASRSCAIWPSISRLRS
ncbi:hypothetical protein VP06_28875 [Methylobacterium aquaticum]|uniref:Uncharacterized protein n=1 Tax=Methylobacterium aquaticum TaxID=270351 RepID=A0A0J6UPR0_9HYPH|nr:hypothetical protein VP06_28875 [Methylobacterium aquaticum]